MGGFRLTEQEVKAALKDYREKIKALRKQYMPRKTPLIQYLDFKDDPQFQFLYPALSPKLTVRMVEICNQVIKGKSNKEIGSTLFICEKTVKFHLTEIYSRLQLKSRAQLILFLTSLQPK